LQTYVQSLTFQLLHFQFYPFDLTWKNNNWNVSDCILIVNIFPNQWTFPMPFWKLMEIRNFVVYTNDHFFTKIIFIANRLTLLFKKLKHFKSLMEDKNEKVGINLNIRCIRFWSYLPHCLFLYNVMPITKFQSLASILKIARSLRSTKKKIGRYPWQ